MHNEKRNDVTTKFNIVMNYKGNHAKTLVYNLYDNAASADFVIAVTAGSDVPVYNTSMCFTKSETVDRWCALYADAVKLSNTNIYDDTIGAIAPSIVLKGYSQDTLNYLHNYVEEYEILLMQGKIDDNLNRWLGPVISVFNDNIHNCENNRVGYESSWLSFRMEPFQRIPLRDEHMELFSPGYNSKKLYLGYSEVGKTLWHMFEADDQQAAHRKQSNPKQAITNEIMLPYFNHNFQWEPYDSWCKEHAMGVDHTDPRQYGQIEIGELADPLDCALHPFDQIQVEIVKNDV